MHDRQTDLLLFRQLFVFLGQDLGEVQVAHLGVDLGILGAFLHEEAEVWGQGFLWEVGMSLGENIRMKIHGIT